jgi:hypothetical protein
MRNQLALTTVDKYMRSHGTNRLFVMPWNKHFYRALLSAFGYMILLASFDVLAADTATSLDADRGVILPSAAAQGVFEQHRANLNLQVDQWEITADDLSRVDAALVAALRKERIGQGLPTLPHYYRQYLPGRLRQSRIVFVNGFDQTESEMFPDRAIPVDQWKYEMMVAYGGGCGFWYGVYLIDEGRFLILDRTSNHARMILCNGPK